MATSCNVGCLLIVSKTMVSTLVNYKPDYIIDVEGLPTDAKNPGENLEEWTEQCSSYCLELNKLFTHNPVKYYILSNGNKTFV
jgi:hypothetical protein